MTARTVSQALATQEEGPATLVEKYRGHFADVLPAHVNLDAWVRVALGELRSNAPLAQAAKKDPWSLMFALLDCARLGLEPGDTYHLVPFGGKVTGIRDYTGEIELAQRAGCGKVTAQVVHENDTFEFDAGRDDRPTHMPPNGKWFSADRGEMVGAYGFAILPDGSVSHVVTMDRAEIMRHKAVSKAPQNWEKWPESYWRKTIIHELRKWTPTSPEFRTEMARATEAAEQVVATIAPGGELPSSDDFTAPPPDPVTDDDIAEPEVCPACGDILDRGHCGCDLSRQLDEDSAGRRGDR